MGISKTMRQSFVFMFFHLYTCFTHGVGALLKLAVEWITCTVGKERRRNLGCPELLHIGRSDA